MPAVIVLLCFCLVAVLFLAVVVLGALRELVLVRQELASLVAVVTEPAAPPVIQQPLPRAVARTIAIDSQPHERHVVAFLGDGCSGCHALLRSMQDGKPIDPAQVTVIITGRASDSALLALSQSLSNTVLVDSDGKLARALSVGPTPTLYGIDVPSTVVTDYSIGGNAEWIRQSLASSDRAKEVASPA